MTKNNNPIVLGERSITKLLIEYSLPAIVAMTATSLYNIIDSIFIGRGVGAMAIAGLAITFPLMNIVVAVCALISAGGAAISSIFLGQGEKDKATETLYNVMIMCIVHGVVFGSVTLCFLRPVLFAFGATDATIGYAEEFMQIILIGSPISYVYIGLNNMMRATGNPKKAMLSSLISVFANVALAPIFIFSFEWGIRGAATATVISQIIGLVWVLSHFFAKSTYIRFDRPAHLVNWRLMRKIYAIGLSPFLMNLCSCLVVILINRALLRFGGDAGDLAVGTYGIINRTAMLSVMIVFGITQGMQPVLGYNYGALKWDRVKQTLKYGTIIGGLITTIGCLLCECFPHYIAAFFTTDATLIDMAARGFRISLVVWPFVGMQIVIQNFFQSVGMPKLSIFLSMTRQLIFLLPGLLIFPHWFGIDGVWISMATGDGLACILVAITITVQLRKMNKNFNKLTHIETK